MTSITIWEVLIDAECDRPQQWFATEEGANNFRAFLENEEPDRFEGNVSVIRVDLPTSQAVVDMLNGLTE